MDLLTTIRDTVSDTAITNLAAYLEEDINGTKLGLNLGIGTFLAGVIRFASTDKTGRGLLGILNGGGHTGDILNNFETFSGKPEKSKLLETIGSNIVNHFLKEKSESLIDKIAGHAGIRNSSSSTLLNLAAPLVLGFLGKQVRAENLSGLDLKAYLNNATADVSGSLPSSLLYALNLPKFKPAKTSPVSHYHAVKELNKDTGKKNWNMLLPWLLLLLVGVMIWYFSRSKEKVEPVATQESPLPEIFLPVDTVVAESPAPVTPVTPTPDTTARRMPETRTEPEPSAPPVEEPVEEMDTTPAGLTAVSVGAFASQSAEVVNTSALRALLTSLQGSRNKLTLTPMRESGSVAVDRAYAIRDYLLENGIEFSRVEITAPAKGRNPSGVAWKINP